MAEADYLRVKVEHHGPVCTLAVGGELDVLTVACLRESAIAGLRAQPERFVLDLSELRFVDCYGARALAALTRAVPADCPVIARSMRPAVRRVLELMGVNLQLRDTVAGSDAARLALQSQLLCSLAQQAVAESRRLARTIAATEDRVADTLVQLAGHRPQRAARLVALSRAARAQAAQFRVRAAHHTHAGNSG